MIPAAFWALRALQSACDPCRAGFHVGSFCPVVDVREEHRISIGGFLNFSVASDPRVCFLVRHNDLSRRSLCVMFTTMTAWLFVDACKVKALVCCA